MDKAEMLRLADRVEALSGPDREVDWLIYKAVGKPPHAIETDSGHKIGEQWYAETYTASLDAAMTLVPEGFAFGFTDRRAHYPNMRANAQCWTTSAASTIHGEAATPALALTAAALRALAKGEE